MFLAKVGVASSSLVFRSQKKSRSNFERLFLFISTSLAHPVRTKTFSTHVASKLIYVVRKTGLFTHASNESLSPATRQASPGLPSQDRWRDAATPWPKTVLIHNGLQKRAWKRSFFWLRFHALSKMISVYQRVTKSPVVASRYLFFRTISPPATSASITESLCTVPSRIALASWFTSSRCMTLLIGRAPNAGS